MPHQPTPSVFTHHLNQYQLRSTDAKGNPGQEQHQN